MDLNGFASKVGTAVWTVGACAIVGGTLGSAAMIGVWATARHLGALDRVVDAATSKDAVRVEPLSAAEEPSAPTFAAHVEDVDILPNLDALPKTFDGEAGPVFASTPSGRPVHYATWNKANPIEDGAGTARRNTEDKDVCNESQESRKRYF